MTFLSPDQSSYMTETDLVIYGRRTTSSLDS